MTRSSKDRRIAVIVLFVILLLGVWIGRATAREESMDCNLCGKKMIQRDSQIMLTSYPPQYPWFWWCGCGNTKPGGMRRGFSEEEAARKLWESENK